MCISINGGIFFQGEDVLSEMLMKLKDMMQCGTFFFFLNGGRCVT